MKIGNLLTHTHTCSLVDKIDGTDSQSGPQFELLVMLPKLKGPFFCPKDALKHIERERERG